MLERIWPLNVFIYLVTFPLAECLFYWHTSCWLQTRSRAEHSTRVRADTSAAVAFWSRLLAEEDAASLWRFLRGWFVGSALPQRGNVLEFLAFTIYGTKAPPGAHEARVCEAVLTRIEAVLCMELAPGHAPLHCKTYTLSPLSRCHKPLGLYLALQTAHRAEAAMLRWLGFRLRRCGQLEYWCRDAAGASPEAPLIFIHGIGGLLPYPALVWQLAKRHRGPVLLPLVPQGGLDALPSSRSAARAIATADFVDAVAALTERHAAAGAAPVAAFAAHSLGTAYLAAVQKARPELVAAASFLDPICFLLHERDVVTNFLYAAPRLTRRTWFHWVQSTFVAREPTVQDCLRRQFWWSHFELPASQLSSPTAVHLSSADTVCEPAAVLAHLRKRAPAHVTVRVTEGWACLGWTWQAAHGWICCCPAAQRSAIAELQRMLAAGRPAQQQVKPAAACDEGDTDSHSSSSDGPSSGRQSPVIAAAAIDTV